MRIFSNISFIIASIFTFLIFLNIYDYNFNPELPWREGDFGSVILLCTLGAALFMIIGFITKFYSEQKKDNR